MYREIFKKEELKSFCEKVFLKCGMNADDASEASEVLISADLRGIDSHGVARLPGYVRLWEKGRANMNPQIKITHQTPSTATVDADGGLGLISGGFAMNIAIEKAKIAGTGWVAVNNSNHFGIAAYHAMKALEHDMIGISMTNASPLVAPTFSKQRMLGTNPVCFVIPAGKYSPVVVDMATSAASNGKLEIAQRKDTSLPLNWVQDKEGNPSTDHSELQKGGSLLPLGGYKGYALSSVVDIFCSVLSGANYGPWVPPFVSFLNPLENLPGKGIGHFFGAMRIDAFRPADEFKQNMDKWIEAFKNSERIDSNIPVLIPGEPEMIAQKNRELDGIPLNNKVLSDLIELASKLGLELI